MPPNQRQKGEHHRAEAEEEFHFAPEPFTKAALGFRFCRCIRV